MNPSSSDVEIIKDSNQMGKANEKEQHCSQRRSQTQQKKQVRRRLHTTKPYQEKPINMAEARREIVAALKFHRAKRKQASQQQRQNSLIEPEFQMAAPSIPTLDSSTSMRSWPTFNTYPLKALPYNYVSSPTSFQSALHPPNFSCSYPSAPSLPSSEPINLFVPNSPLGLNLNLHDFEDLETTVNDDNSLSFSFSSSAATTSSSSLSPSSYPCSSTSMLGTKLPLLPPWPVGMSEATSNLTVDSSLSILDEQEIAEIHYIGDQYEMEWNDDLNLLQSDWGNKFLETVDASSQCQEQRIGGGDCVGVSDEISSCPPWTSDQQLLDDLGEEGSFEDACLPCLDIEDIEGMDGGWLF